MEIKVTVDFTASGPVEAFLKAILGNATISTSAKDAPVRSLAKELPADNDAPVNPGRVRRTKAEIEADNAAKAAKSTEGGSTALTLPDVRKKAAARAQESPAMKAEVKALISSAAFGKPADLEAMDPSHYEDFLDELKKLTLDDASDL